MRAAQKERERDRFTGHWSSGRQPGQPLSRLPGCLPHKRGPGSNRAGGQPGEFHHHGSEASTGQSLSRRMPRLLHLRLGFLVCMITPGWHQCPVGIRVAPGCWSRPFAVKRPVMQNARLTSEGARLGAAPGWKILGGARLPSAPGCCSARPVDPSARL